MSNSENMIRDTGMTGQPALMDKELDPVTGGSPLLFQYCATGRHLPGPPIVRPGAWILDVSHDR